MLPKMGCCRHSNTRGCPVNRSSSLRSSIKSRSNSAGGVPPSLASHSGTVETPCGHRMGAHNPIHLKTDRLKRLLFSFAPLSPMQTRNASHRWQTISATVIRPQRRWLAGPILVNLSRISCLSGGFASVFMRPRSDSKTPPSKRPRLGRRHRLTTNRPRRVIELLAVVKEFTLNRCPLD
jgi:hypothetical protein